jgi:hypothetical protein
MENTFDKTATETIELLEARLRRIEYAVCGQLDEASLSKNNNGSATQRLQSLEHSLHQLASKSRVVQDLLKLRGLSLEVSTIVIANSQQILDTRISSNR